MRKHTLLALLLGVAVVSSLLLYATLQGEFLRGGRFRAMVVSLKEHGAAVRGANSSENAMSTVDLTEVDSAHVEKVLEVMLVYRGVTVTRLVYPEQWDDGAILDAVRKAGWTVVEMVPVDHNEGSTGGNH